MAGGAGSGFGHNPADRQYTAEHEWIKPEGEQYVIGITAFAQDQLGDIVYVELPKVGDQVEAGKAFGVIESVKTASDLYAPVSGEVVEVNAELVDQPQAVNDDPYERGWMIKIRAHDAADLATLLTAEQYAEQTGD
jgi:glycine cleavage system H protein